MNHMAPDVFKVRHLHGTVLEVCFADGCRREIDVAELAEAHGVFADIRSADFVASVRVNPDTGTIEWPSGADFSPDVLYQAGKLVGRDGLAA